MLRPFDVLTWRLRCSIPFINSQGAKTRRGRHSWLGFRIESPDLVRCLPFGILTWRLGVFAVQFRLLTAKAPRREGDGTVGWASELKALTLFDAYLLGF